MAENGLNLRSCVVISGWLGWCRDKQFDTGPCQHAHSNEGLKESHLLFLLLSLVSLWANQKLILLEDWESMKMVDGSTVRHGRVDCGHHERAGQCSVSQPHGEEGKERITKRWEEGMAGNRKMQNRVKEKWKEQQGMCRYGWWGSIKWSEKGRKKKKSTAGRNQSDLSLDFFPLPFHGKACFKRRVKLNYWEEEVRVNPAGAQSYETH